MTSKNPLIVDLRVHYVNATLLFCTMLLNSHERETNIMYFWVLFEIMISKYLKFKKCQILQTAEW